MKYPEIKVNVPEPCHEDWNKMTSTEKGKFCGVCTKEVVDFTSNSDEEIVKHLTNHGNICGRFHASQLDRRLIVDRKKRNHWLSYAASFLLPITLFSQEIKKDRKIIPQTEQTNTSNFTSLNISSLDRKAKVNATLQNKTIIVSGTVTDDSGLSLPGATIEIKGTNIGTTTDFDGNFSIKSEVGNTLIISYVGFASKEIKVDKNSYTIALNIDDTIGEVIVIGYGVRHCTTDYFSEEATSDESKARKKSTDNYFSIKKKKWKEKREKRRAERAKRRAAKAAKKDNSKS